MTVSRRILWQVAGGVIFVVTVVTAVTFWLVYESLKQRDLRQIDTYVSERAEREEARFQVIETNMKLVRGQFLKRLAIPMAPERVEERFHYWNRQYPDGAWRTREQFGDARKNSSMWADRDWPNTLEMRRQTVIAQELCDEMLPGWVDSFPSYYFQFPAPGLVNVGVDVLLADWSWKMPGHFDTTGLEWIRLALPENPGDRFSWTGLQQDDVISEPLVCTFLPVLKDGVFLASVGHNMPMSHMIDPATHSNIPGADHFIVRADARLMAHPRLRSEILKSKGLLTATNCGDEILASLYRRVSADSGRRLSGFDPETGTYYSVARLAGPEWLYATTVSQAYLRQQAFASARWVVWSGLISLAFVLGAIALVLKRQVDRPLLELKRATQAMSSGAPLAVTTAFRDDELGQLAEAFRDMSVKVFARENELRQLTVALEQRVSERTEALAQANLRLADSLQVEKELGQMRANFVSLVSHEFRTPLEVILTSSDILDRYLERLSPEKRAGHLRTIHESVKRMSAMMEDVLLLGRIEAGKMSFTPKPVRLEEFSARVLDELESATGRSGRIELKLASDLPIAQADEALLRHMLVNLLSNALKYSPDEALVSLQLTRTGRSAVFIIADRGRGIPAADRARLFQSFQRGSNVSDTPGTGLGLLLVKKCVDIHGGSISFTSEEGLGTTFEVVLPILTASNPSTCSSPESTP